MVSKPYVHHVPVMTGGVGYDVVFHFYKNYFVGKMPQDTKIERLFSNSLMTDKSSPCCQEYLQPADM